MHLLGKADDTHRVLYAIEVHTRFAADSSIHLCEQGGRDIFCSHTALIDCCNKAADVGSDSASHSKQGAASRTGTEQSANYAIYGCESLVLLVSGDCHHPEHFVAGLGPFAVDLICKPAYRRVVNDVNLFHNYLNNKSAVTIAAIASTITGQRRQKQASCLPFAQRLSCRPLVKL